MDNKLLIEAKDVCLKLDGKQILDKVDIRLHKGEIVTLIGPNGAGKSTLVRVILGLLKHDSGEVRLAPKLRIGYMPQRLTIDPVLPLTVRRFLTLAQRCPESKLTETLAEVGAEDLLDSAMQTLSGGETQRVLLARAAQARQILPRELRKRGATVHVVPVYQTILPPQSKARDRRLA